eukprot:TRINITY_DN441_c0_g1_i4.p1 TRINITY_DN441_c0_g1~~TRINITY_DN441_c0_g1_i4.p1  ORF type:complete len:374 (-),score=92.61 TRINITY_DN441_c0_g1_i4:173-1294(-)
MTKKRLMDDELDEGDTSSVQGWAKEDAEKGGFLDNCRRDGNSKSLVVTGVLVCAVVLLVVSVAMFTVRRGENNDTNNPAADPKSNIAVSPIPEGAVTETFLLGNENDFSQPLEVPVQPMWMRNVKSPRPAGNIAIHQVHLSAVDENYKLIPQHILYNHHSLILVDDDIWAAFGAEGAQSYISLKSPNARILRSDQQVNITTMYLPLKGFAAMTPTRVFVNFTLVYTKLDNENGTLNEEKLKKWTELDMDLMGIFKDHSADFNIPGDGEKGSAYCETQGMRWRGNNATLVQIMGHLHIGGINLTFVDSTNNGTQIASVAPLFDQDGFVVQVGGSYVDYPLVKGNTYTTIACYHNDRPFKNVMGLFHLFYYHPRR